ncbi:protein containing ATPase domain, prokaryote [Candidatus Magnetomorum sp. HK-1]|nr:protein containing ATPase domain, prokaryote [Candidatus Magnetomorum sp. HK-1]
MKYKHPKRTFEDTGFVNPEQSYYVPLGPVVNRHNQDMKTMVDHGRYFSIFAPRQSGKTTFFNMFAKSLEENSNYIFILMSFENYSDYDLKKFYHFIQDALYEQLLQRLKTIKCHQLDSVQNFLNEHVLVDSGSFYKFFKRLNNIIKQKKIAIFIDEFDGIPHIEIKNFLTTLRKLYQEYKDKKDKALYSVGLVGIRNITQLTVGGVSPFNIADHVELPSFTLTNTRDLYQQYAQETNQPFAEEAIQKIFEETQGQPWLVNRFGSILTTQLKPETNEPIETDDVNQAIQILLKEKNNHFDNLKEKVLLYKESFKKIHLQQVKYLPDDDAQSWLYQYGLIKEQKDFAVIANPIYKKRFSNIKESMISNPDQTKTIFISYSHEDKAFVDKLIPYLNILKVHKIKYWFDEKIRTGEDWPFEIQTAIETAHLSICLLSNSFLGSSFIQELEFPAIQAKQKEGMVLFPVLIKDCLWKIVPWFKNIQIYPKNGIPLEDLNEKEQNKKLMEIVQNILDIFDQPDE